MATGRVIWPIVQYVNAYRQYTLGLGYLSVLVSVNECLKTRTTCLRGHSLFCQNLTLPQLWNQYVVDMQLRGAILDDTTHCWLCLISLPQWFTFPYCPTALSRGDIILPSVHINLRMVMVTLLMHIYNYVLKKKFVWLHKSKMLVIRKATLLNSSSIKGHVLSVILIDCC